MEGDHPDALELASRLAILFTGRTGRGDEAAILAMLDAASAPALAGLSLTVDWTALVGDVDDHRLGPKNRSALLRLLCRDRLGDLPVAGRARLLAALQRGITGRPDEEAVADLICGTHGDDLFELKRRVDRAATYRDLHQLVFRDVDGEEARRRILEHLQVEARGVAAEDRGLRVVSDVDDTLWANWKDARWPKKTVYPGVRAFYREVARRVGGGPERHPGELVFLTARPRDRAGVVEEMTHATLRKLGIEGASVLSGALRRVVSSAHIARGKLENFREYRLLYPEDDLVFVGDSGQGDVEVAVAMREEAGDVVRGAFIHDVVATSDAERARLEGLGVDLFDTYPGAAWVARSRGLLADEAASRVAHAAELELRDVSFPDDTLAGAIRALFARDLSRVRGAPPGAAG